MRNKSATRDIVQLLLSFLIIGALAWLSSIFFIRLDLTSEKRHTLTDNTIEFLEDLDEIVYLKVYLKGDYPAMFKQLETATREKLQEMRAYSGGNLEFEFINPSEVEDKTTREENYRKLIDSGLRYTTLQIREKDGVSEKIIFPAAEVTFRGKTLPLQLLKSQERLPNAEMINNSINNLEYELMNVFYQLYQAEKPKVAFLQGHDELDEMETGDIAQGLDEFYEVDYVQIDGQINALTKRVGETTYRENIYDALIVAKPTQPVDDKDKYIIDQFVMHGGKVIWLLDAMDASMDSLERSDIFMSRPMDLNLDDQLFKYGVRIQKNLLIDRTCAPIGIMTGPMGNQQQMEYFPWYFTPLIVSETNHPIVSNLDPIVMEFVSSIETLPREGIEKNILLTTSPYTRIFRNPARVSLNIVRIDPDFGNNRSPNQPVAVLLKGTFESTFKNRLSPLLTDDKEFGFKEESEPTSMLVVADGDVARNQVNRSRGQIYPLGFDRYAGRKLYGNREFLVNAVNYMLGDASLISIRSRNVTLRQLDMERLLSERLQWQILNIVLPVLLIFVLGFVQYVIRRRKYTRT